MNYLNYLQQYRETYHLDDIFIPNNNVGEEQVKEYIENLTKISFSRNEELPVRTIEKLLKESAPSFYTRIILHIVKNSILKDGGQDLEYLTRFILTSIGNPEPEILESLLDDCDPRIRNIVRKKLRHMI